jgi:predicted transposase/invertase (TIGR01784 family)
LWEQDSALFLTNPALLPLAALTKSSSPQTLLEEVAEQLASIEESQQRQNLASYAGILAGLRFEETLIRQLFQEDIMRESVIYQSIRQEGKQEGLQEGKQEGLQEGLKQEALTLTMRLLQRRFGKVEARIIAKVQELSREQLETLTEELLDLSELDDLDAWLGYPGIEND